MNLLKASITIAVAAVFASGSALAQDNKLRLLTWADYAPKEVVDAVHQGDRHRRSRSRCRTTRR